MCHAAVEPVFTNGAWDHDDAFSPRNAYIAALLSKDIYYQHGGWDMAVEDDDEASGQRAVADMPTGRADRRLDAAALRKEQAGGGAVTPAVDGFCGAMQLLGADSCE